MRAAIALGSVGEGDHVTDMSRVPRRAINELPGDHEATAHAGRHDHPKHRARRSSGSEPPFAERHGFRVVVDHARNAEPLREPGAQRKVAPGRDVKGRDQSLAHRTAAPDTDRRDDSAAITDRPLAERGDRPEELLCIGRAWRAEPLARPEGSGAVRDGGQAARAANVEREDGSGRDASVSRCRAPPR